MKPKPSPKVSGAKYGSQPARVRIREKGSGKEGHVYQGQRIILPCKACNKEQGTKNSHPPPFETSPPE